MPIPIDLRKKPAGVKLHVTDGTGLDITWADRHVSHYDFSYLRDLCPCATCDDERHKRDALSQHSSQHSTPDVAIGTAVNPLQMYKARPGARAGKQVGHYALQIDFTDGHSTGIYSYDYLRSICPCTECAKVFRSNADEAQTS